MTIQARRRTSTPASTAQALTGPSTGVLAPVQPDPASTLSPAAFVGLLATGNGYRTTEPEAEVVSFAVAHPDGLGRCSEVSCAWRWRDGITRACYAHNDDALATPPSIAAITNSARNGRTT